MVGFSPHTSQLVFLLLKRTLRKVLDSAPKSNSWPDKMPGKLSTIFIASNASRTPITPGTEIKKPKFKLKKSIDKRSYLKD